MVLRVFCVFFVTLSLCVLFVLCHFVCFVSLCVVCVFCGTLCILFVLRVLCVLWHQSGWVEMSMLAQRTAQKVKCACADNRFI